MLHSVQTSDKSILSGVRFSEFDWRSSSKSASFDYGGHAVCNFVIGYWATSAQDACRMR
jgi:hypothetical protein